MADQEPAAAVVAPNLAALMGQVIEQVQNLNGQMAAMGIAMGQLQQQAVADAQHPEQADAAIHQLQAAQQAQEGQAQGGPAFPFDPGQAAGQGAGQEAWPGAGQPAGMGSEPWPGAGQPAGPGAGQANVPFGGQAAAPAPPGAPQGVPWRGLPTKVAKPEPFTGAKAEQSVTQWLSQIEDYMEVSDVQNDYSKILITSTFLKKAAAACWQRAKDDLKAGAWEACKLALLQHFQPVSPGDPDRLKLFDLKQRESVSKCRRRAYELSSEITDSTDGELRNLLMAGLKQHIQRTVLITRATSLQEAANHAALADEYQWQSSINANTQAGNQGRGPPRPIPLRGSSTTPSNPSRPGGEGASTAPMELGVRRSMAGVTGYTCNQKGHIARNCPDKNKGRGAPAGSQCGKAESKGDARQYDSHGQGIKEDYDSGTDDEPDDEREQDF